MIGRFWFYRRRRVLPFMAAYCLVCINTATLAPLVPPTVQAGSAAAPANGGIAGVQGDFWHWANYQRGSGVEPDSVVAAGVPPLVKNLRRPAPSRHCNAAAWGRGQLAADPRAVRPCFSRRAPAANAVELARFCRLLL